MINLDALQKAAESTDYNLQIKPEVIIKLVEIARVLQRARGALSMPVSRWNKTQSEIVSHTLASIDDALREIQ